MGNGFSVDREPAAGVSGRTVAVPQEPILMAKYVYFFGGNKAEGRADMKNLLGGKGANLAEVVNIGLAVPAGFTLAAEVCNYYDANSHQFPAGVKAEVEAAIKKTEMVMGAMFGDLKNPLL